MPENWTELDDSTFYLHSDIIGSIADYRSSRDYRPSLWVRIRAMIRKAF